MRDRSGEDVPGDRVLTHPGGQRGEAAERRRSPGGQLLVQRPDQVLARIAGGGGRSLAVPQVEVEHVADLLGEQGAGAAPVEVRGDRLEGASAQPHRGADVAEQPAHAVASRDRLPVVEADGHRPGAREDEQAVVAHPSGEEGGVQVVGDKEPLGGDAVRGQALRDRGAHLGRARRPRPGDPERDRRHLGALSVGLLRVGLLRGERASRPVEDLPGRGREVVESGGTGGAEVRAGALDPGDHGAVERRGDQAGARPPDVAGDHQLLAHRASLLHRPPPRSIPTS